MGKGSIKNLGWEGRRERGVEKREMGVEFHWRKGNSFHRRGKGILY